MKQVALIILVFIVTAFSELCAQKSGEFDYPEDSVAESSRKAFVKHFNQGKVLYSVSCAKCHNLKEGRKDIIPDFSLPQLMDYEMRIYPEHSDKLNDTKVTDEEMKKIILFLRFKKKSGKAVRG